MGKKRLAIAIIGLLLLAGCSSPYMKDRGRDGADVFTLTIGYGLGAKARAGPVSPGVLFCRDAAGLRGGDVVMTPANFRGINELHALVAGYDVFLPASEPVRARHKGHSVVTHMAMYPTHQSLWEGNITPAYYTDLEVVVAAILALRVGFNPRS